MSARKPRSESKPLMKYVRHRSYMRSDRFFADLVITDLDYSLGPFYLTFIESTGIPVDIRSSVRRVKDRNPARHLKRLLSERKTELRLTGTSVSGNETLKKQVTDLERILWQYENEGIQPVNVNFTFRIYADHPAILNQNIHRIKSDLGFLGVTVCQIKPTRKSIRDFFLPTVNERINYLMNTRYAATILPVFRDPNSENDGIAIGVDDLSERLVHFNVFSQNSYNMLIVGETGSGKSYFGKLLLTRSIESGLAGRVIVFDPLNEYSCSFFNSNCTETDMRTFVTRPGMEYGETPSRLESEVETGVSEVTIIKGRTEDMEDEDLIGGFLKTLNRIMMGGSGKRTLMAIDECHIILKSTRNAKILGQMVRHSRHYDTGIVNISQNADDFLNDKAGVIALNSNHIFIFRTRNLKETHKKVLKLDDFDTDPPERLMGGKMHPYSECLMTDGEYCRKLRVISTESEDKRLQ